MCPLLLHHQGGGAQVHEGQGAPQHTEPGGGVQPVPDAIQCLDIPEGLQVLVNREGLIFRDENFTSPFSPN